MTAICWPWEKLDSIRRATVNGNLKEVRQLVEEEGFDLTSDSHVVRDFRLTAVSVAAKLGQHDIVEFLIPYSLFERSDALEGAACQGHTKSVRLLMPHYTSFDISEAMVEAAHCNQWECVDALLSMNPSNTDDQYELSLIWASAHNKNDYVERLYPLCNPIRVVQLIDNAARYNRGWSTTQLHLLTRYNTPEAQRERLEKQVDLAEKHSARKAKI